MTAILSDEIICFRLLSDSLSFRSTLSSSDIIYTCNYLTSFYSFLPSIYKKHNLALFLVYIRQQFALTFNSTLDLAIKSKDHLMLQRLFLGPREMFVELYNNVLLTPSDKNFILRYLSNQLLLILDLLSGKQVCSSNICFSPSLPSSNNLSFILSSSDTIPSYVYIVDVSPSDHSFHTPQVFYISTFDIVKSLCTNNINPKTSFPFSPSSISQLRSRFRKEIALYTHYLFSLSPC